MSERPTGVAASRVLGIDLGEKRIGVAVGDSATGTAAPLTTLRRARTVEADARTIAALAAEQRAGSLVVGLPLDMDGGEGAQAAATRAWAEALEAATGLAIAFRDERLTSERAERRIGGAPRGRAGGPPTPGQREAYRARVDREAAALILQDALDGAAPTMHRVTGDAKVDDHAPGRSAPEREERGAS